MREREIESLRNLWIISIVHINVQWESLKEKREKWGRKEYLGKKEVWRKRETYRFRKESNPHTA